jgi:hypothetical protein
MTNKIHGYEVTKLNDEIQVWISPDGHFGITDKDNYSIIISSEAAKKLQKYLKDNGYGE